MQGHCLFELIEGSLAAENVTLPLVTGLLSLLLSLLLMLGFVLVEGPFDKQGHNGSLLPFLLRFPLLDQLPLLLGSLLLHFDIAAVGHLSHLIALTLLRHVLFVVGMALDLLAPRVQVVLLHFGDKSYRWAIIASSEIPAAASIAVETQLTD